MISQEGEGDLILNTEMWEELGPPAVPVLKMMKHCLEPEGLRSIL